jgi:hypothetical protein
MGLCRFLARGKWLPGGLSLVVNFHRNTFTHLDIHTHIKIHTYTYSPPSFMRNTEHTRTQGTMSVDHEYRSKDALLASAGVLFAPAQALQDSWIPECACSPQDWIESHLCWASTPSREVHGDKVQDIGTLSDLEERSDCQTCRRLYEIVENVSSRIRDELVSIRFLDESTFWIRLVRFAPPDV